MGASTQRLPPFGTICSSVSGESEQINEIILNASDLLPNIKHAYRYNGSLTTPPCSEDVKWFVLTTPIEMSQSQIAAFKAIFSENNRPVQTAERTRIACGYRT